MPTLLSIGDGIIDAVELMHGIEQRFPAAPRSIWPSARRGSG